MHTDSCAFYWCGWSIRSWGSIIMTPSNGKIFRVTGPLWGEPLVTGGFTPQGPVTRSFAVFFDLRLDKLLSKQSRRQWFETPSRPLWRHCNVWYIYPYPQGCISGTEASVWVTPAPMKQPWRIWVKSIGTKSQQRTYIMIYLKQHDENQRGAILWKRQRVNIDNYINPGYGLSLVDTLWNASSYRQPLEQEGNPMT